VYVAGQTSPFGGATRSTRYDVGRSDVVLGLDEAQPLNDQRQAAHGKSPHCFRRRWFVR
jgi:hypothetical protein